MTGARPARDGPLTLARSQPAERRPRRGRAEAAGTGRPRRPPGKLSAWSAAARPSRRCEGTRQWKRHIAGDVRAGWGLRRLRGPWAVANAPRGGGGPGPGPFPFSEARAGLPPPHPRGSAGLPRRPPRSRRKRGRRGAPVAAGRPREGPPDGPRAFAPLPVREELLTRRGQRRPRPPDADSRRARPRPAGPGSARLGGPTGAVERAPPRVLAPAAGRGGPARGQRHGHGPRPGGARGRRGAFRRRQLPPPQAGRRCFALQGPPAPGAGRGRGALSRAGCGGTRSLGNVRNRIHSTPLGDQAGKWR